jgi:hypothetical protein
LKLIDIDRNSLKLIDIDRNSLKLIDIDRNSLKLIDIDRNSLKLIDIDRNKLELIDIDRKISKLNFIKTFVYFGKKTLLQMKTKERCSSNFSVSYTISSSSGPHFTKLFQGSISCTFYLLT